MTKLLLNPDYMDASARPQDDLFRYVNGTWIDTHQIPADRAVDGAFHQLRERSEKDCHEIIKSVLDSPLNHEDQIIATLYSAFMSTDDIEAAGISALALPLDKISQAQDKNQLAQVMGELMTGWLTFEVAVDAADPTRNQLHLWQCGICLPDESYYREDTYAQIREKYVSHIQKMAELAQWESPEEFAAQVWELEKNLAAHHWNVVDCRDADKTNNPLTLAQIEELAPQFPWKTWFAAIAGQDTDLGTPRVHQPSFLQGAAQLWQDFDLDQWKQWARWQVLNSFAPLLSGDFVQENFNFFGRVLSGSEKLRDRWKRAVDFVEKNAGEALGKKYVAKHFPAEHVAAMEQLVDDLLEAYRLSISELEWMGEDTRQKALEKLRQFTPKIGAPKKWKDYSSLSLPSSNLVQIQLACSHFATEVELAKLPLPVDRDEWLMTPQTVNAYYYPLQNEIVFPAAILQPPFFDPQADEAVNYGAIGAVIGHEIGHGFDDQGSKYDGTGAMQDWWTEADRKAFEARTGALIEQYNQLSPRQLDDSHRVNGALTIGENIGDLGGLSIAYKAWQIALKRHGIEDVSQAPEVEGVPGAQAFFFSWATCWRTKMHDEIAVMYLAMDPHSPAEFRCNTVVSNMDSFAAAFDLKSGDGLWRDPSKRVKIW